MAKLSQAQAKKLKHLCENIGAFIEYWGFKRAQGELWMRVYASEKPVSADELQAFFGYSRALTHSVLAELMSFGLIDRIKIKNKRKHYFSVTEDVWQCISRVLNMRERRLIENARDAIVGFEDSLGKGIQPTVQKRIRFLRHLCNYTLHGLSLLIQGSMIPGRVEVNISKLWKRFQTIKPFGRNIHWPSIHTNH
jgi:HTH-type transcriptional regulator, glycine betaine synthesis regulator